MHYYFLMHAHLGVDFLLIPWPLANQKYKGVDYILIIKTFSLHYFLCSWKQTANDRINTSV